MDKMLEKQKEWNSNSLSPEGLRKTLPYQTSERDPLRGLIWAFQDLEKAVEGQGGQGERFKIFRIFTYPSKEECMFSGIKGRISLIPQ